MTENFPQHDYCSICGQEYYPAGENDKCETCVRESCEECKRVCARCFRAGCMACMVYDAEQSDWYCGPECKQEGKDNASH